MNSLKDRIEEIITLIAEVANGNFGYQLNVSDTGDELDAVIAGVNMLGQELKKTTVSRDYMNSIFEGMVDMLLVLNTDFTIKGVNKAFEEYTGFSKNEVIGKHLSEVLHLVDGPLLYNLFEQFKHEGRFLNAELTIFSKISEPIPTTCSFSYLKTIQNQEEGVLVIAKDISELKRKEEELKEAKAKAEAATKAKSNFLAHMSHEIRTPLNGMIGFANLLLDSPLSAEQRKYADLIRVSSLNLTQLLNDILDFRRIEQDKVTLELVPFNVREVVASQLEGFKQEALNKGLSFSYTFEPDIPEILIGDQKRIYQILMNLVSNAIKFTNKGDITVHASLFSKSVLDNTALLMFTVTDTGIGVSDVQKESVFESFSQLDQSKSKKYAGYGLGLAISKKLVHLMQGEIGMISPLPGQNKGSAFWFTIKLEYINPKRSNVYEHYEDDTFKLNEPANILVVDDNIINVILIQDMLERFEANVVTAKSGEEALKQVHTNNFDLVFMDIQMPDMDGIDTSSKLRMQGFSNPIVSFTANNSIDDLKEYRKAGMDDHLSKPFTTEELVQILRKWL